MQVKRYLTIARYICCMVVVVLFVSGCFVRSYSVMRERPDQEISGNQGYLTGKSSEKVQTKGRKRKTYVIEFEFGRKKHPETPDVDAAIAQDLMTPSPKPAAQKSTVVIVKPSKETTWYDTYVVKKNDTLEKIAGRTEIYGDKYKWQKIYEANKDILKSPHKIYEGQTLKIPRP